MDIVLEREGWDIAGVEGKAAATVYTGQGVGAALVDAAISGATVFSPIPGTGEAYKAARIVESGVQVAKETKLLAGPATRAKEALQAPATIVYERPPLRSSTKTRTPPSAKFLQLDFTTRGNFISDAERR